MTEKPDAVARVEADAEGLKIAVVETAKSARSAEEAAKAVGASVGQIVKSLVFKGTATGQAYLLLVSGANRVDEASMATHFGEALERPDADFVRQATGFAIGGVSPLGASRKLATLMDEDLFQHATVWAAAGTPRHVFEVVPLQLRSATGATVGRVT
ncbi:YbaK/EbsC family protein [Aurantimonas sp. C2-6-R+9]|uniref:YbaK/EbsC family protein n=1 Tax=unclassified Aurantimonas TaxID=2638230 RepID=UPI002E19F7E3|nr:MULTISPECIES: YbaK/EbsC family protein [unclassified Aurantimonas]MEC5292535.1 YbaK/EbsC family protein [Aurantimonas sp. C2-3-R2]MEC5382714.1 YbaK/EbsC family protein [Aurantimonas sp. C2-6-R+9]MEC5413570.1 YbaK/EbsC family protein [Aurantimonas sp. C2-4-R8]